MARTGGLNTLVSDPEVRLNAVEREAGERQRDQARHDQMMQLIEKDAGRSKGKLGKMASDVYENMSDWDKAALYTALIPGVGDIVGAVADTRHLIKDPSLTNAGFLLAGLLPFVPSGGVTRTAQKAFTNLRNEVPGFYAPGAGKGKQAAAYAKTLPEGISNIARARYLAKDRAIQNQFNISVADRKTAKKAIKVSEKITPKLDPVVKQIREMKATGKAYTGQFRIRKGKDGKPDEKIPIKTREFIRLEEKARGLRRAASEAANKAMGQGNQSRSMIAQFHGANSAERGFTRHWDEIDHVKTFDNFNVKNYIDEVGDLSGMPRADIEGIFKQIQTHPAIAMNPNKNYMMNIRRAYTGSAGKLDPGMDAKLYSKNSISLSDIKKSVFSSQKKYTSNKKFLEALQKSEVNVLNPEQVLRGRAAIITGSSKTDAYELGGVNHMTAINKEGKVTNIVSDEHDLLSSAELNKLIRTDAVGKLPGASRYMNVSEPIVYDLIGSKKLTKRQKAVQAKLKKTKDTAVEKAIEEYKKIPGVDISGKLPAGFKTKEQWARSQAIATLRPTHPDYSRLAADLGIFAPLRVAKTGRESAVREKKKGGGSVMERNPYDYKPKAI